MTVPRQGAGRHVAIDVRMVGDAGIGTYIRNLVGRIAGLRPEWRFTLLGSVASMRSLRWDRLSNVKMRECGARIYTIAEQVELAMRCPRDVDLFWSPHYNIPLAHRGRLMVTVHDVSHLAMPQYAQRLPQRVYARTMFGAVSSRADAIVCDSAFSRRELLRYVTPRVHPGVVHLGVEPEWYLPRIAPSPRAAPYILFVGSVKPHKNLVNLIRAFDRIREEVPHDLVIVGRREGMRTVDEDAGRLASSLGPRVVFTGELPMDELRRHVGWAEALVVPSLYEGFGLPPLEAMAAGCPTLVSRAASLPEVCGDASLYCDPLDHEDIADKLRELLSSAQLRQELRDRGAQHVTRFTWDRCAGETLQAMEGAMAR